MVPVSWLQVEGTVEPKAWWWVCMPGSPWDRVPGPCSDWHPLGLALLPTSGSHAGPFAALSSRLWLSPRVALLAGISPLLPEMGFCCPLSSPEWPPDRRAVSGPLEGAPLATRGGLGSDPHFLWHLLPPPICCLLLFADTRAHVSKCASLPSQPPPQRSHSRLVSTHKPPPACPGTLPGLPRPGRQPASVFGSLSSF